MNLHSSQDVAEPPINQVEKQRPLILALIALGVVYGDIGTSPLYALRESFHPSHGLPITPENILGILSLIVWSLILVISVKYLGFILKADNRAEGGILALTILATSVFEDKDKRRRPLLLVGLFGTALLFGDGIITPAISVLSAVEGLRTYTPVFGPFIIPITIGILIGLFSFQRHGTEKVGRIFGPITLLWFLVLAGLGIWQISHAPEVLKAIYPGHAISFFIRNGWHAFMVLGSVFLVITGGEALYSDLGHFGKRPIRAAWFSVVFPALILNYMGQGGLLLRHPEMIENPFFLMAPKVLLLPLVLIAPAATVIA
ncbi:MAG: KUP/HAK/KT family potassium transporter, partial [Bdellovibrionia bacterium]